MLYACRSAGICLLALVLFSLCSCGVNLSRGLSYASEATDPLANYTLTGDTLPVLDPSIIRQGSTFYAFSTDVAGFSTGTNMPIHCSQDRINWTSCGGIKQRQIDAQTGKLSVSNSTRYDMATRPAVPHNPIEGASLVRHGKYYYLFVSVDYCCERDVAANNYKQAVGRSSSPHGPFV